MADTQVLTRVKATAQREGDTFRHNVQMREHQLTVDEPLLAGGEDTGPDPRELLAASLASCTAITMEMYAARKGWDIGHVEVDVEYGPAQPDAQASYELVIRLPRELSDEQVERLRTIATKCPVRRALDHDASFQERVERAELAA